MLASKAMIELEQQIRSEAARIKLTIEPFGDGTKPLGGWKLSVIWGNINVQGLPVIWKATSPSMGDQHKYHHPLLTERPRWAVISLLAHPDFPEQESMIESLKARLRKEVLLHDSVHMAINNYCIEQEKLVSDMKAAEEARFRAVGITEKDRERQKKWLQRITKYFKLPITASELLSEVPDIRFVNLDTMRLIAGVLTQFPISDASRIDLEVVRELVAASTLDLLVAFSRVAPNERCLATFLDQLEGLQREGLTDEQKMDAISTLDLRRVKKLYPRPS